MNFPNSNNLKKLLTLSQAAQELEVSIDSLLQWNDFNILKPTITLSGEVGYTQEQIDRFRAIQRLSQDSEIDREKRMSGQSEIMPVISDAGKATSQINNLPRNSTQNAYANPEVSRFTTGSQGKSSLIRLISPLSAMIILLIATITLYDNNLSIPQKATENTKIALTSPSDKSNFSESYFLPIQVRNGLFSENRLNQTSFVPSKFAENGKVNIGTNSGEETSIIGYSQIANFPKNTRTENNLFDDGGNIKGETTGPSILAMALDVAGISRNDNSLKPTTDSNVLLTFLALGLLTVVFILRKQLMYSVNADSALTMSRNFQSNVEGKKVLEVNQKTDGTVVLCLYGKEYKLCKPDLDSESDQFIERLMSLSSPDIKEIDYDSLGDEKIRFNASLSKLVTRLGFVGIKRDLFFPRTSKSRVLFRRYITGEDLISMNLTDNQISNEFSNNIEG